MIDPQNDHLKAESGNQMDIRQVFGDQLLLFRAIRNLQDGGTRIFQKAAKTGILAINQRISWITVV
jgi:hypothetical protein